MQLTPEERAKLTAELAREDLQGYTVVRLAQRELASGQVETALARLRVDADKLRAHDTFISELLIRPR